MFDSANIGEVRGVVYEPPPSVVLSHESAIVALIRLCEIQAEVLDELLVDARNTRSDYQHVASVEWLAHAEQHIARLRAERDRAERVARLARLAAGVPSFVA